MGVKTGPGGFDINGKNYTFDPGELNNAGGEGPIDSTAVDNDVNVDDTVKDLSGAVKTTLGDYLSDLTNGKQPGGVGVGPSVPNHYPLDGPTTPPTDTPITDDKGVPQPPLVGAPINLANFMTAFSGQPENGLNLPVQPPDDITWGHRLGNSQGRQGLSDPAKELVDLISKGKTSPQLPNGNEILANHDSDGEHIGPYVATVLSNNRFSAANRSTNLSRLADGRLGEPGRNYNPVLRHPRYGDYRTHDLSKIGHALGIRASRELNATQGGLNPTAANAEAVAILPGSTQLGATKVPLENLSVANILEDLPRNSELIDVGELETQFDDLEGGRLISITDGINDGSWGSLNNVHDQWTGITALGMIALSVALVVGVTLVFGVLGVIINAISGGGKTQPKGPGGRYALGRYTITPNVSPSALDSLTQLPPDFAALIGIRETTYSFGQALEVGTLAFFGIEGDSFTDLFSLDALDAAVTNPGWNAIVARTIVRSSTQVIDAFANIGGNPIAVAKGILNIIDVLRSSKLIAAMNTFANLGDQVLVINERESQIPGFRTLDPLSKLPRYSGQDAQPNNIVHSSVRKNRLNGSLKLAWANNRSPSAYLIPDSLYTLTSLAKNLGSFDTGLDTPDPLGKNFTNLVEKSGGGSSKGRIPYETDGDGPSVVKIEKLLDAEYMPFYFHDLRTNEIISFQAFITALTDDFSPAWEKSEGFGRVDQVRTYKNTQRMISLSFIVASTSQHDFLDMWTKINKLVTLVYPGYTPGREIQDEQGNYVFVQPFSQLIGASPVIRLRLGDLFRSNSSRFALARLFGADLGRMKLDGEPIDDISGGGTGLIKLSKIVRDVRDPHGSTVQGQDLLWITHGTNHRAVKSAGTAISIPIGTSSPKTADVFNPSPSHRPYITLKIEPFTYPDGAENLVVSVSLPSAIDLIKSYGMSTSDAKKLQDELTSLYDNPDAGSSKLVGGTYAVPRTTLALSPVSKRSFLEKEMQPGTANVETLTKFLDPEKNALIKSFKETGGKGLAGTIESLGFDFYENVTWETTALGSRAPQFLRVNMTFSPIHDISPGLDYNGYNRGPVYPVGYQSPANDEMKSNK